MATEVHEPVVSAILSLSSLRTVGLTVQLADLPLQC